MMPSPVNTSIVNKVVYLNGQPVDSPATLAETFGLLERQQGSMAWIGLYRPGEAELMSAAEQFGLHELAVEDAITAHQRPKLERYGDTLFVVLRSAHYRDETEEVDFGELHLFVGPNFVLTVRHNEAPDLAAVRHRLENRDVFDHATRCGREFGLGVDAGPGGVGEAGGAHEYRPVAMDLRAGGFVAVTDR